MTRPNDYPSLNFDLGEHADMLRDTVRSFSDDEIAPIAAEVDRTKAKTRNVSLDDLYDTLQINLGSLYVNQFNKYGKVYRVYLQAEAADRAVLELQARAGSW